MAQLELKLYGGRTKSKYGKHVLVIGFLSQPKTFKSFHVVSMLSPLVLSLVHFWHFYTELFDHKITPALNFVSLDFWTLRGFFFFIGSDIICNSAGIHKRNSFFFLSPFPPKNDICGSCLSVIVFVYEYCCTELVYI